MIPKDKHDIICPFLQRAYQEQGALHQLSLVICRYLLEEHDDKKASEKTQVLVVLQQMVSQYPETVNTRYAGKSLLDIVFSASKARFCGGYVEGAGAKEFGDEPEREPRNETLAILVLDLFL